jgi:hypothetical protein
MDPALAYLETQRLGRIEQHIELSDRLTIPPGVRARAHVVHTTSGLYLVAARGPSQGLVIDLMERGFSLERGTLSDRLLVGEVSLAIPRGKRRALELAVGLARLEHERHLRPLRIEPSRHVGTLSLLERAFLEGFLAEGETLLGFLDVEAEAHIDSTVSADAVGRGYFFLSDRRAAHVVLSHLGDVVVDSLDDQKLEEDERFGGSDAIIGRFRWRLGRGDLERLIELGPLLALDAPERLRESARLNWIGRADAMELAFCRALLARLAGDGDPRAIAASFLIGADLAEPRAALPELEGLTRGLAQLRAPPDTLAELWQSWRFSPEAATTLLDELRARGDEAEPWALELHRRLHERLSELRRDPKRLARADVELAEHWIRAGHRDEARQLLEARLAELPSERLRDLLPRDDADLTTGAGGQVLRIRVFELLAEARGSASGPDVRALAELARLQPLVTSRVEALAKAADGSLAERARAALAVLGPGGLSVGPNDEPSERQPLEPLSADLVKNVLRHPATREGGELLGRLQALLARVPVPDHRMLREYVEPITEARQQAAARALGDAARVLGVDGAQGFVSRGKKAIGLRGYDGPPPFLLIGGRHLEGDPEFTMRPAELAFAVACEVAHLRYGHSRITSSDIWAGTFDKGKQGLDLFLGILPLMKGWRVAEQAYRIMQKVPIGTIKRAFGGARSVHERWRDRVDAEEEPQKPGDERLGAAQEELVATARVMQLTADRAGLVLAGDLRAAIRAMLLVRSDHREELAVAEREGIEVVLAERRADGVMVHQDLAIRVAALVSFQLSEDFPRLRAAMGVE